MASHTLPGRDQRGQPSGGFSAAIYLPEEDRLRLLSDAPQGSLSAWTGLRDGALRSLGSLLLRGPEGQPLRAPIDGEGLLALGRHLWVASEGRRTRKRTAGLLRFEASSGRLTGTVALPESWRPVAGGGLEPNGGPESLTLWQVPGQSASLLVAAEAPLLQDPPDRVRLAAWPLTAEEPAWRALGFLELPGRGWGLTDLHAVNGRRSEDGGLLALFRRFEFPDRWQARLAVFPLPAATEDAGVVRRPLLSWDLLEMGLPADNWEVVTAGPVLADGRRSLLLASDDNFSSAQESHLVTIAPRRGPACSLP